MALGIGLVTFMFSVVYGIFGRGIGIPEEDRFVTIWSIPVRGAAGEASLTPPSARNFIAFQELQWSLEGMGAVRSGAVNVSGRRSPGRYSGAWVTTNTLDLLMVEPVVGRGFVSEESLPGAAPRVLLSHDIWAGRYESDPDVLGQTIRVDGVPAIVVGVMPEGFKWPGLTDMWLTLEGDLGSAGADPAPLSLVFGRLADDVSLIQAEFELDGLAHRLRERDPTDPEVRIRLLSFIDSQSQGPIRVIFSVMMVAVFLVLVVASANVANMLLARACIRTREAAICIALGGRFRVMSPFLAEAVVLTTAGAFLGIGLSYYAVHLFDSATASSLTGRPAYIRFDIDVSILLFVIALTGVTAVVAGAAPALQVARMDPNRVLKDEQQGSSSLRLGRLMRGLVVFEIAVSCALLVGAGLMTKSIAQVSRFEFGSILPRSSRAESISPRWTTERLAIAFGYSRRWSRLSEPLLLFTTRPWPLRFPAWGAACSESPWRGSHTRPRRLALRYTSRRSRPASSKSWGRGS